MADVPTPSPRSSDRVALEIQISIFGADIDGRAFSEETHTVEVSRYGALILTRRNLGPQDEIVIRRGHARKELPAQVVGQVRKEPDGFVYAVIFSDPSVDLWDINFGSGSDAERAVIRTLLECAKCRQREVVYLGEFETEVYTANRYIYLPCKRCRETTIWNETAHDPLENGCKAAPPPVPLPPPASEPRVRNERRYPRIACKLRACIRYDQHYLEEVLAVRNVSRGGVCFTTRKYLATGTRFEIAIPYSPDMANIFVPAEVVRVSQFPGGSMYEYGAAYLKDVS
jgi:hypothetical protein